MILKGNQRGGGRQMALHLLNADQNEHIDVHEVRGFISDDVRGALAETYALSKATKCKQYMYSLSLNPPENARVDIKTFEQTIERAEKKLGLAGQPRVIVFHEKEGRRHAHCVWSRIKIDEMKAINMSFDHDKLHALSKQLYIDHDWKLPPGFIDKSQKSPLNFNRAEWHQALRTGQKPQDIKAHIQECWAASDNKAAFEQALKDKGYFLAQGHKGRYLAIDTYGEVYSVSRQLGKTIKDLKPRLGNPQNLPTLEHTKQVIAERLTNNFKTYRDELQAKHKRQLTPLLQQKEAMTAAHRQARAEQKASQELRRQAEEVKRSERLRKGFQGLWDRLTGAYKRTRRKNEVEVERCATRDRKEKETLINTQLQARQTLQQGFKDLRQQQKAEQLELYKTMNRHYQKLDRQQELQTLLQKERQEKQQSHKPDHDPQGPDFGPEM